MNTADWALFVSFLALVLSIIALIWVYSGTTESEVKLPDQRTTQVDWEAFAKSVVTERRHEAVYDGCYLMSVCCSNCGQLPSVRIRKGDPVPTGLPEGTCPYCGSKGQFKWSGGPIKGSLLLEKGESNG
jgi:hypothetical protein